MLLRRIGHFEDAIHCVPIQWSIKKNVSNSLDPNLVSSVFEVSEVVPVPNQEWTMLGNVTGFVSDFNVSGDGKQK